MQYLLYYLSITAICVHVHYSKLHPVATFSWHYRLECKVSCVVVTVSQGCSWWDQVERPNEIWSESSWALLSARLVLSALQHASGRVQSEQAVQAADVKLGTLVDITRVQLM